MSLTIYTDGSCKPNPGKGGWGYIAIFPDCELHINGGCKYTTNNRMEMTAVIEAITEFYFIKNFDIYTDSQYVINCSKHKSKRKKNVDLWKKYDTCSLGKNITFHWVKGHAGNNYNELVDKLAKDGTE